MFWGAQKKVDKKGLQCITKELTEMFYSAQQKLREKFYSVNIKYVLSIVNVDQKARCVLA